MKTTKLFVALFVFSCFMHSSEVFSQNKKKSPTMAAVLSAILPGTGQFYTEQPDKGWLMMGLYTGALALVIAYGPWTWEEEEKSELFPELAKGTGTPTSTKIIWYGSAAIAGVTWIWSVTDASSSAKRINRAALGIVPYLNDGQVGIKLVAKVTF